MFISAFAIDVFYIAAHATIFQISFGKFLVLIPSVIRV